jgi:hypothetical protein
MKTNVMTTTQDHKSGQIEVVFVSCACVVCLELFTQSLQKCVRGRHNQCRMHLTQYPSTLLHILCSANRRTVSEERKEADGQVTICAQPRCPHLELKCCVSVRCTFGARTSS